MRTVVTFSLIIAAIVILGDGVHSLEAIYPGMFYGVAGATAGAFLGVAAGYLIGHMDGRWYSYNNSAGIDD